ncbi:c-type cytochrome [Edaphobacter aggregans]|uniref:c-type cytochrome n=1 Tax=Edaphobacter aggregans TaxID=570835 RepID=UPI00068F420E|nr:cytochrome c [Edaphobacter aggregans]
MQMRITIYGTLGILLLSGGVTSLAQSGADTYKAKCAMCHAADGSGNTPAGKAMKANPFNSPDVVKMSDAELIAVVTDGKAKMPGYKGKLTDAQIKDVVAYIRTLQKK